jgi:hypothetical protein
MTLALAEHCRMCCSHAQASAIQCIEPVPGRHFTSYRWTTARVSDVVLAVPLLARVTGVTDFSYPVRPPQAC